MDNNVGMAQRYEHEIPEGYEAALERCKQWVAGTSGLNPGASPKEVAEYLFPELTESEDERIRKEIISFIKEFEKDHYRCIDFRPWIAYLERQKEQRPAEWSEEDEIRKNAIANWLVEQGNAKYSGFYAFQLIDWLKSLRPQPHWKPSEYQMQGLRRGIVKAEEGSDAQNAMKSLYEDLKKL